MVKYIKVKNLGLNVATNCTLLDKSKADLLLHRGVNSGDYLMYSILGASKKVHEAIMVNADHYEVLRNISDLISLRKKYKVNGAIVEAVFYKMPENEGEENRFIKSYSRIVDHAKVGRISRSFRDYGKKEEESLQVRTKTCKLLWERMTIYWNGDVTLCAWDVDGNHTFGNIREKSY